MLAQHTKRQSIRNYYALTNKIVLVNRVHYPSKDEADAPPRSPYLQRLPMQRGLSVEVSHLLGKSAPNRVLFRQRARHEGDLQHAPERHLFLPPPVIADMTQTRQSKIKTRHIHLLYPVDKED